MASTTADVLRAAAIDALKDLPPDVLNFVKSVDDVAEDQLAADTVTLESLDALRSKHHTLQNLLRALEEDTPEAPAPSPTIEKMTTPKKEQLALKYISMAATYEQAKAEATVQVVKDEAAQLVTGTDPMWARMERLNKRRQANLLKQATVSKLMEEEKLNRDEAAAKAKVEAAAAAAKAKALEKAVEVVEAAETPPPIQRSQSLGVASKQPSVAVVAVKGEANKENAVFASPATAELMPRRTKSMVPKAMKGWGRQNL